MALRNILTVEEPVLHKTARPVTRFDAHLGELLDDMRQTLTNAGGVGLAAPQIGILRRVVVVDAAESPLFEQIIYIVRDDAASGGVTAADLVQQARDAVGHVPAAPTPRPRQKSYTGLLIWLCSVAGVLAAGIGYCLYCGW
mgnify:CR=1 FL=1